MTPEFLSLNCEALDEFRTNLDEILKLLINNLVERNLRTGTVNAKIKVTIENATDGSGAPVHQLKLEPDLWLKIGAKGQMKCKAQSGLLMKYTEDGEPVIGPSQISVDEYIRELDERRNAG